MQSPQGNQAQGAWGQVQADQAQGAGFQLSALADEDFLSANPTM